MKWILAVLVIRVALGVIGRKNRKSREVIGEPERPVVLHPAEHALR